jgi:hypothetical protein
VSLLVREDQVDEVVDEVTQLVKDEVCVGLKLYCLLFFFRLDQAFQTFEAFLENVRAFV